MAEEQVMDHGKDYFILARKFATVCTLAELVSRRKRDGDARASYFWLANFVVYDPGSAEEDSPYLTVCGDGHLNPFKKMTHRSEFEEHLSGGEYPLTPELDHTVKEALVRGTAVRISYAGLSNSGGPRLELPSKNNTTYLIINPLELVRFQEHRPYFNESQRALLTALYGAPQDHGRMLMDAGGRNTAIIMLAEPYVREQPHPFVRACWTNTVDAGSLVELCENFKENDGFILGVLR
ncbi:MAG: hypothetical protein Q7R76_02880 [Candidatus Woesearchaeota archaeon]|nr:hypothetical protein [Candidatus Woesearchaeota archaeon]